MSDIVTAGEWMRVYMEQSAAMQDRYLTPGFARSILAPLVAAVPYVPINKPLVRVVGSSSVKTLGLKERLDAKRRVTSCTWMTSKKDLDFLADSIGASGEDYCYVVSVDSSVEELFNTEWILKKVVPVLRTKDAREAGRLREVASYYRWQKEVVCWSPSPVTTKVILDLSWVSPSTKLANVIARLTER